MKAKRMIATGAGREPRPPMGSWEEYGLGTENQNLPAFVEIMPGQPKSTPSAFLPSQYGSTAIGRTDDKSRDRVWDNLTPGGKPAGDAQRRRLDLVRSMDRSHVARAGGATDAALE